MTTPESVSKREIPDFKGLKGLITSFWNSEVRTLRSDYIKSYLLVLQNRETLDKALDLVRQAFAIHYNLNLDEVAPIKISKQAPDSETIHSWIPQTKSEPFSSHDTSQAIHLIHPELIADSAFRYKYSHMHLDQVGGNKGLVQWIIFAAIDLGFFQYRSVHFPGMQVEDSDLRDIREQIVPHINIIE